MEKNVSTAIALGLPGQIDGRPTLQSDRGDETQQQFSYQCVAGLVLLCGALACRNDYQAVWLEHHDDLLAECGVDLFDAIQSKTSTNANQRWRCSDKLFLDAVRKFCGHEATNGSRMRNYIFFSNVKPYIPGPTTKKDESLASSPMRLVDECKRRRSAKDIVAPYKDAFAALATAVGVDPAVLFRAMRKLVFQKGPALEAFIDQLPNLVAEVPECSRLNMARLREIGRNLYDRLHSASILDTAVLSLQSSPLAADGRELAAIASKRVTVEDARAILLRHPGENFLYDNHGLVRLGKVKSQKDVLRSKMKAGGVERYFTSIWLQAVAAESRLMEEVLVDAKQALKKLGQLESAVLVECQNAEAAACLEPDGIRGQRIYQQILIRTQEMSSKDSDYVLNERPETLRGMAGLLSGSCHFAWGTPPSDEAEASDGV